MSGVRVFAPATVANVACGFDVFGFALEGIGDEVVARAAGTPGVRLDAIEGDGGLLPLDVAQNTAGVAAQAVLDAYGGDVARGLALSLRKGIPAAGGLGSSAASAVAGALAANTLLDAGMSRLDLLRCALKGEAAATGVEHADNAAACLYGGFVLVRTEPELRVDVLPYLPELACAIVHPHVEVQTRAARAAIGESVPLAAAVRHMANTAALVDGLHRGDFTQIASALEDVIAEPARRAAVPGFDAMLRAARHAGAFGGSLSGSGPSVFALCHGMGAASEVAEAMRQACLAAGAQGADAYISRVGAARATVLGAA